MEASRRHETPGSDTRYFIAHSTANNVKFIFASVLVAPVPCPTGVMRTRWGKRCVQLGHSWETLSLEIQISDQANLSQLCPEGKHSLFPTGQETTVPSAHGRHSLSSNVLCVTKLLEKIVWKESCSSGPLFPRPAKPEDTRETCLPTMAGGRQGQIWHYLHLKILSTN